jgi:hypothetical protein
MERKQPALQAPPAPLGMEKQVKTFDQSLTTLKRDESGRNVPTETQKVFKAGVVNESAPVFRAPAPKLTTSNAVLLNSTDNKSKLPEASFKARASARIDSGAVKAAVSSSPAPSTAPKTASPPRPDTVLQTPENSERVKTRIAATDGSRYDGEVIAGMRDGEGVNRYQNGDTYTGSYKKNMREGNGKITYANGSMYDGEWHRDKKEGYGKYVFANKVGT